MTGKADMDTDTIVHGGVGDGGRPGWISEGKGMYSRWRGCRYGYKNIDCIPGVTIASRSEWCEQGRNRLLGDDVV